MKKVFIANIKSAYTAGNLSKVVANTTDGIIHLIDSRSLQAQVVPAEILKGKPYVDKRI
jgi:hypothetical protein